jgi:hypothetical protein
MAALNPGNRFDSFLAGTVTHENGFNNPALIIFPHIPSFSEFSPIP